MCVCPLYFLLVSTETHPWPRGDDCICICTQYRCQKRIYMQAGHPPSHCPQFRRRFLHFSTAFRLAEETQGAGLSEMDQRWTTEGTHRSYGEQLAVHNRDQSAWVNFLVVSLCCPQVREDAERPSRLGVWLMTSCGHLHDQNWLSTKYGRSIDGSSPVARLSFSFFILSFCLLLFTPLPHNEAGSHWAGGVFKNIDIECDESIIYVDAHMSVRVAFFCTRVCRLFCSDGRGSPHSNGKGTAKISFVTR